MVMVRDKNDVFPYLGTTAFYTIKMLEGIPKDLVGLFVPDSKDELIQLEMNIIRWLAKVQEREKVMQLQRYYNLPLRPNQSLRDVIVRLKIIGLKESRKFRDSENYSSMDEDNSEV